MTPAIHATAAGARPIADGAGPALALESGDAAVESVDSVEAAVGTNPVEERASRGEREPDDDPFWLLYAPTVLGALALVFGTTGLLEGLVPSLAGTVTLVLTWATVLVALFGTLFMVEDARALRQTGAAWRPDARPYVVVGALGVTLVFSLVLDLPLDSAGGLLAALAGMFIVGTVASTAVSGPLYLYQRHRRLGRP
ncbi:MAG: hypothetical protein ABEJ31_03710 [Haloarculaceae archaeon]